jgi:methionyl-tRNA formyltransferase
MRSTPAAGARNDGGCEDLTSLAFLGTPDVAVLPLQALHRAGHDIRLVVSRPDKRRGRGGAAVPSPVKRAALELGLPVTDRVDDVVGSGAELGVVVAFGRLIRPHVLAAVPMINLHFSLLPRWRGAAPVERAILAGDTRTGACLMTLEEGLDTGPVHACRSVDIGPEEALDELRSRLAAVGTDLLVEQLRDGLSPPAPQQGEPTYAPKIEPDELRLDWALPALQLSRVVRLGRAWTTFRGRRLLVLRARPVPGPGGDGGSPASPASPSSTGWTGSPGSTAPGELVGLSVVTGEGALELIEVQPESRAPLSAADWRNGARPAPGERLGG